MSKVSFGDPQMREGDVHVDYAHAERPVKLLVINDFLDQRMPLYLLPCNGDIQFPASKVELPFLSLWQPADDTATMQNPFDGNIMKWRVPLGVARPDYYYIIDVQEQQTTITEYFVWRDGDPSGEERRGQISIPAVSWQALLLDLQVVLDHMEESSEEILAALIEQRWLHSTLMVAVDRQETLADSLLGKRTGS